MEAQKTPAKEAKLKTLQDQKAERDRTYPERRAKAFASGRSYKYLVCPLCLRARILFSHFGGKVKFKIDPNPEVVQIRYSAGGRAAGWFKKDDECIRLKDVQKAYPEVYANLKEEVSKLYKLFNPIA
jgi:hypothetical protein